jgi:hypothetical protein
MTSEVPCVIHVLSARPAEGDRCKLRGTVRAGNARPGLGFWFADAEGARHEVTLTACEDAARGQNEFTVEGSGVERIRGGSYLYALPASS